MHSVRKTGVLTEHFKSDISQTRQNLNNYEPKLKNSFKITWLILDIFQTAGKMSEKKKTFERFEKLLSLTLNLRDTSVITVNMPGFISS